MADGDLSTTGVAVLPNTLELNGGAIRSASAIAEENAKLAHVGRGHNSAHRVVTPATGAPILQSASVTGTTLTLTFSEGLGAAASLANSAFTVKKTPQEGAEETVSLTGTPGISGATVTLTLANAVLDTDTWVKVGYDKPASGANNKLIDKAGNEVESFADEWVTNTMDTTQPRLVRGQIDGDTVTLFFSEPLREHSVGGYARVVLQISESGTSDFIATGEMEIRGNVVTAGLGKGRRAKVGLTQRNRAHYVQPIDPTGREAPRPCRQPGVHNLWLSSRI